MVRSLILVLGLLLTVPAAAAAQTGATLSGVVQDGSGGVLPGATITARHIGTGVTRETVSGADGRFVRGSLQAGNYEVRSKLSGFRPLVRSGVNL